MQAARGWDWMERRRARRRLQMRRWRRAIGSRRTPRRPRARRSGCQSRLRIRWTRMRRSFTKYLLALAEDAIQRGKPAETRLQAGLPAPQCGRQDRTGEYMRLTIAMLIAAACFGQGKQNMTQTG